MTEPTDHVVPTSSGSDKDISCESSALTQVAGGNDQSTTDQTLCLRNNTENEKDLGDSSSTKSWGGWIELENHPMIFSTLLREWGVPNICVQEVLELDGLFDARAESIYGLILLSRWTASETVNELSEPPDGVWFANQVQSFSCATVSLINIVMNHPELDLGEDLNAFRSLTQPMNPLERGWELDRNDKIRDVHNSFGTDIDRAKVDYKLQQDFQEAKKQAKEAERRSKKKGGANGSRKKRKQREDESVEEENGFHFIAYVPVAGAVWKMDGMERLPRKLGDITPGDSWISPVLAEVINMRETAAVNQFEMSLLSLVQQLDHSGIAAEADQMDKAREDWGPFLTTLLKLHGQRGDLKEIMGGN